MTMADQNNSFKTSDLYFAAYLGEIGLVMVNTEEDSLPNNRKKVYFVYNVPAKSWTKIKADFFSGKGKVSAKGYGDMMRSLKQLCFA